MFEEVKKSVEQEERIKNMESLEGMKGIKKRKYLEKMMSQMRKNKEKN